MKMKNFYLVLGILLAQFSFGRNFVTETVPKKAFSGEEENVDLQLRSLDLAENTFHPGSTIPIRVALFNDGKSDQVTNLGYYLSTDSILDNADLHLSTTTIISYHDTIDWFDPILRIDSSTAEGRYFLIVKADVDNELQETDESNNLLYTIINVQKRNIDLWISFEDNSPASIKQRETFGFNILVENKGTTFSENYFLSIYLSKDTILDNDDLLRMDAGSGLGGGEYQMHPEEVYISERVRPGDYYLLAYLQSESSTDNNLSYRKITILPLSNDFTVSISYRDSIPLKPGASFNIEAIVSNKGNDTALAQVVAFFLSTDTIQDDDDYIAGSQYILSMGANSDTTIYPELSVPINLPGGKYYIFAVADVVDEWQETDETNNTAYTPVTILPDAADLVISPFSVKNNTLSPGTSFTAESYVKNLGTKAAGRHYIGFFFSADTTFDSFDTYLATELAASIDTSATANFSTVLSIPNSAKEGIYYILAVADFDNIIPESDENNNLAYVQVVVKKETVAPDLTLKDLYSESNTVISASYVNVAATVLNIGKDTAGYQRIAYYFSQDSTLSPDDFQTSTEIIVPLIPDASYESKANVMVPYVTSDTKYFLIAKADFEDTVKESNEDNNILLIPIFVEAVKNETFPDLTLKDLYAHSNIVIAGSYVDVAATVLNIGKDTAGYHRIAYYFSQDSILSPDDFQTSTEIIVPLSPDASYESKANVMVPYVISDTKYFLIAKADFEDTVKESNEDNNILLIPIFVQAEVITGNLNSTLVGQTVSVYPNPTNGEVSFTTLDGINEIEVTDATGSQRLLHRVNSLDPHLDLSHLGAGVYTLKLSHGGQIHSTHRVVVTK